MRAEARRPELRELLLLGGIVIAQALFNWHFASGSFFWTVIRSSTVRYLSPPQDGQDRGDPVWDEVFIDNPMCRLGVEFVESAQWEQSIDSQRVAMSFLASPCTARVDTWCFLRRRTAATWPTTGSSSRPPSSST